MNPRTFKPFLSIVVIVLLASFCPVTPILSQNDPAQEWHVLYSRIRDRLISKEEALAKLKELEPLLKDRYLKSQNVKLNDRLVFPLKGYGASAIGGKGGSGYQVKGYNFFDGNQHKGHPGHDIFVRDKDQDGLDDVTRRPI